jgi:tetratricopeptide (TPR) repeat protein
VLYTTTGNTFLANKQYEAAEQAFTIALFYDEAHASAYFGRGISFYYLHSFLDSIEDFDSAQDLGIVNFDLFKFRGFSYHNYGNYRQAINNYLEALVYQPENTVILSSLGAAYYSLSDYENALDFLTQAIEHGGEDAYTFYHRGLVNDELGFTDNAQSDFQRAIELDRNYWLAYLALGNHYMAYSDYREAADIFTDGMDVRDEPLFYLNRGIANYWLGEYVTCLDDINIAIESRLPRYLASAYYWRASCHYELGSFLLAYENADESLLINPNYYFSFYLRAEAGFELGIDYYEQAIADYHEYEARSGEALSSLIERRISEMQQALDS